MTTNDEIRAALDAIPDGDIEAFCVSVTTGLSPERLAELGGFLAQPTAVETPEPLYTTIAKEHIESILRDAANERYDSSIVGEAMRAALHSLDAHWQESLGFDDIDAFAVAGDIKAVALLLLDFTNLPPYQEGMTR